jgi:RHS repeat-associated protein
MGLREKASLSRLQRGAAAPLTFKWYSVASSTGTGAKYATTTEYAFNGDSLISTTDQQPASGAATGTAQTRYIHPDHLGSTNVVTNASGTVVQTLDYYPYGATRISSSVGGADSARKYIGQFADQSNLDYLNARYYDSGRGQFLTEDPVFLGEPKAQNLENPQSLNSYSYANDNPITGKDPSGRQYDQLLGLLLQLVNALTNFVNYLSYPIGQVAVSNAVDQSKVVTDKSASTPQKAGAVFFMGLSLIPDSPAGKAGGGAKNLKVVGEEVAQDSSGFFGKKGYQLDNSPLQTVPNAPTTINGISYSGHALDQMQNRGIVPSIVENTIKTGTKYTTDPGTVGYYDSVNSIRVVQNQDTKQVITVIRGAPKNNGQ